MLYILSYDDETFLIIYLFPGAAHHDDLLYLFTLSYRYPVIPLSSPHSHVVDEMTALWYNFARYG